MNQTEQGLRNRLERYRHLLLNFDDRQVRQAIFDHLEDIEHRLDEIDDDDCWSVAGPPGNWFRAPMAFSAEIPAGTRG
jgi:hypothetical protein